jgi:hypothetical protein
MFSPLRDVLDLPVRAFVAYKSFGDQFLSGMMEHWAA